MAQAGVVLDKDQFNCPICLDVLRDPVTIPCGHSYCCVCIQDYWDQDDYLGVFVCPQCRQNFSPRPALARNTMLADVVEKFKRTGIQEATVSANQSFAEADDVECDVCAGRKNKAVKSCLVCLASYCDVHVQPHYESAAFKKHKLVSANKKLQETICPRHDKLLEVYCRTDKQCICYLCLTDEHKGHDTVLAEVEIQQKQRQLSDMKQSSQLRIQLREKEAQELRQAIFSLTSCQSLHAPPVLSALPSVTTDPSLTFGPVMTAVSDFKVLLQEVCQGGFVNIYEKVRNIVIVGSSNATEQVATVQSGDAGSSAPLDATAAYFLVQTAVIGGSRVQQKKLQETSLKTVHKLKDTEKELRYIIRYIKKCKSLHFHSKPVEMPSTDALQYLMFKTMRASLVDLKDSVDETLEREFNKLSEKVLSLKETSNQSKKDSERTKGMYVFQVKFNSESAVIVNKL
ncbi:hypothetical protein INR49_013262 [Caranx melampygus]|nr:hypothetical protein INR49_013262 [Caranx melampygus]